MIDDIVRLKMKFVHCHTTLKLNLSLSLWVSAMPDPHLSVHVTASPRSAHRLHSAQNSLASGTTLRRRPDGGGCGAATGCSRSVWP